MFVYALALCFYGILFCTFFDAASAQTCNSANLLDDFRDNSLNLWGGVKDGFGVDGGRCVPSTIKGIKAFGHTGKSLMLAYDVSTDTSFSGYFTRLNNADLSKYNYLSFMVKGDTGGEFCRLQLSDESESKTIRAKISLWDYLPNGPDTTWKKVFIPLDAFYSLPNRESIDELAIVFEHVQSELNQSPFIDTIYFDNFVFGTFNPGFIKIDNFDDWLPGNALGGNLGVFSQVDKDSTSCSIQITDKYYGRRPNGLLVTYDKSGPSDFSGVYLIFGDGKEGTFGDISRYENLFFIARALNANVNPEQFRIELISFDEQKNELYWPSLSIGSLTSTNKSFEFNLSSFRERFNIEREINLNKISGFNILFEDNFVISDNGKVVFDDIEFRKSWYHGEDLQPPPTPTNVSFDGRLITGPIILSEKADVTFDLMGDLSKIESFSLIYRPKSGDPWLTHSQSFAENCANGFKLELDPGALPTGETLAGRIIVDNYNGQQSASSVFEFSVDTKCPFFSCDSLFKQSFQVFQFFRNDTGAYRDAARFIPPQFHPASVANIGMGLVSLCIADSMGWISDAQAQALLTLKSMNGKVRGFMPEKNAKGFFRHFIDMGTGGRAWDSEFSTIDTGILVAGALFCKKYFEMDSITIYADQLYHSIDWDGAIANPVTGRIYLTQDSLGNGEGTTAPFNEYMLVAWLALHDSLKNSRAKELWRNYYQNPRDLPKSSYQGKSVLTDVPGQFLSGFAIQFSYYLCHYFTTNNDYLQFFKNAMEVDKLWWQNNTNEPEFVWGFGAGASPDSTGYHADNLLNHPGTICSPQIIAGFIPIEPSNIDDLKKIYSDSRGFYSLPDKNGTKLLWRFSTESADWIAGDVQGVDFSTMLFGLAAHPNALGPDFFSKYNNFDFPSPLIDDVDENSTKNPVKFSLYQNFPNPFNPETIIKFELPTTSYVRLVVFDIKGEEIITLIDERKSAGAHLIKWDGRNRNGVRIASGIYFYRLETENFIQSKKLILLR